MSRVRGKTAEAVLHFSSLCLLVGAMAAMNEDVRRAATDLISGDRAGELMSVAAPLQHALNTTISTIGPYANGSMLVLALVSVVLVGFMLCT